MRQHQSQPDQCYSCCFLESINVTEYLGSWNSSGVLIKPDCFECMASNNIDSDLFWATFAADLCCRPISMAWSTRWQISRIKLAFLNPSIILCDRNLRTNRSSAKYLVERTINPFRDGWSFKIGRWNSGGCGDNVIIDRVLDLVIEYLNSIG